MHGQDAIADQRCQWHRVEDVLEQVEQPTESDAPGKCCRVAWSDSVG